MRKTLHIVCLGGGNAMPTAVLEGLKKHPVKYRLFRLCWIPGVQLVETGIYSVQKYLLVISEELLWLFLEYRLGKRSCLDIVLRTVPAWQTPIVLLLLQLWE